MKHLSVTDVVNLFLKNELIAAPMQMDGNTSFWSYNLSNRLMGWISELDDQDGQRVTASVTFGKVSEGYENGETLWLLKTTFSPPEPLHFAISEVGLCSIGFELESGDAHLLRLLDRLHRSALDFPNELLIGIERLPLTWFEQS